MMPSKTPFRSFRSLLAHGQSLLHCRQRPCGSFCRRKIHSLQVLESTTISPKRLVTASHTRLGDFWYNYGSISTKSLGRGFSSFRPYTSSCIHPANATETNTDNTNATTAMEPQQNSWRFRDHGPLEDDQEIRVLLAGPHFHAAGPALQAELDRRTEQKSPHATVHDKIVLVHAPTPQELWEHAPTAHIAIPFMEAFSKDFFGPTVTPKLRLVVQFGVGLEGVDLEEATLQGIAVSNVPAAGTGNAQATAEHAMYLGISLLRHFPTQDYQSRFPNRSLGGLPIPRTIYRKRVTVVGYGAVGSCLARYLSALGATVTVLRRRPWEPEERQEIDMDDENHSPNPIHKANSLKGVLPTTDILFLACTLTPETRSLVNASSIALLPRGALVVNVARGPLVDHGAMLHALQSGQIGGFASDVGIGHPTKASEPWDPSDDICRLGPNANVVFTPHVGGYSDASYAVMVQKIVDAIEHVVRGEGPPVWVNGPPMNT